MAAPDWWGEVKEIFETAGIPESVWLPIMRQESNGRPQVVNDTRGRTDLRPGTVPELSVGLFQFNLLARFPNATPEELEALIKRYQDPVYNASQAAAKMANTWNQIKELTMGEPETSWAPLLAVRSGWPGGSVTNPCRSDWCLEYMRRLENTAKAWVAAGRPALEAVGGWGQPFDSGSGGTGSPMSGGTGGPGGGGYSGYTGTGAGTVATPKTWRDQVTTLFKDVPWSRVIVIGAGAVLMFIGLYGLMLEGARRPIARAVKAVGPEGAAIAAALTPP